MQVQDKELILTATNLDVAIQAKVEAHVEEDGQLTVPAKSFGTYVGLLSEETVAMVSAKDELEVRSSGSKTKIKGLPAQDFPPLPKLGKTKDFALPAEHLSRAIDQVAFAASSNTSRPVLTGVYWVIKGDSLKLVATDSYRLAERTILLGDDTGLDMSFIVPARTTQELGRILSTMSADTLDISVSKSQVSFSAAGVELRSRLIEMNYPPYEKVLPESCKTEATLSRDDFLLALKRASVIVRESSNNVRVSMGEGKLKVQSEASQLGEGESELLAAGAKDEVQVALNVQYLLDVLSHIEGNEVYLGLNDKLSPVKVMPPESGEYVYIIMPLKV